MGGVSADSVFLAAFLAARGWTPPHVRSFRNALQPVGPECARSGGLALLRGGGQPEGCGREHHHPRAAGGGGGAAAPAGW